MTDQDDEITALSATEMCAHIRRRTLSPVEIMEAHLRRAERLNPALNAIVTFAPDALERARAAERMVLSGAMLPPLHGLPVTIKDTIDTKDLRTTSGAKTRAERVPDTDAPAVARLRAAGAIVLGKTNSSELALDYTAENPVFGRTNNPHDLSRTPGGSSGGCAAAVSACLSPLGLGSDLVGSVRIPAHFCGVSGLYPTPGRVPNGGHFPPTGGPFALASSLGPLARRVEDLAFAFAVLTDSTDAPDKSPNKIDLSATTIKHALGGRGVAWSVDDGVMPVTTETRSAVEAAARALGEFGVEVVEARPPGVERATDLWLALFAGAVRGVVRAEFAGREAEAGTSARALLHIREGASALSLDEYFAAWFERDRLRALLLEWMHERPLIITPVGASPAFTHGTRKVRAGDGEHSVFRAFSFAQMCNLFGLPAATVPAGRSLEGLPVGVQIIGRPFAEAEVLAAARVIEAAGGGWQPPKLTHSQERVDPL